MTAVLVQPSAASSSSLKSSAPPNQPTAPPTTHLPSSLLLCEALGFSPQLLLDDIINISNNAVQDGVNGMEEFLLKWVDEREERRAANPDEGRTVAKGKKGKKKEPETAQDLTQEIEQGLVAFQTLLEHHTDIAFDFFEAWSLRNIFFIPSELEQGSVVVLPHYAGADLTEAPAGEGRRAEDRERDLMEKIEDLRKRLDEQRRLTRLLTRALAHSKAAKSRAEKRFTQIASVIPLSPADPRTNESPGFLSQLLTVPQGLNDLYTAVSSLPPPDASLVHPVSSLSSTSSSSQDRGNSSNIVPAGGAGSRQWEAGTTGYINWAVNRLALPGSHPSSAPSGGALSSTDPSSLASTASDPHKQASGGPGDPETWVDKLESVVAYVGSAGEMREATGVLEQRRQGRGVAGESEEEDMEVDS